MREGDAASLAPLGEPKDEVSDMPDCDMEEREWLRSSATSSTLKLKKSSYMASSSWSPWWPLALAS